MGRPSGHEPSGTAPATGGDGASGQVRRLRQRFARLRPAPGGSATGEAKQARWLPSRSGKGSTGKQPGTRRRRRPRTTVLALVSLLISGLVGYALLGSSLFLATTVSVRGEQRLTGGAIRQAAAVPADVPLARLDTGPIARRIAALPAVAHVDVRRAWPHTVRIAVTERVPVLAVPRAGSYLLLDAAGVAFASVPTAPRRLPQATLTTVGPSDPTTKAVVGVVTALGPALRGVMRRITASSDSGVTLVLRDGRQVVWGADDRSQAKAEVLAALLKRKGRVYDVSAPDVVTVAG